MNASWVAGSVRGRLLNRRRLGVAGARDVAAAGSTEAAVALLAGSAYGRDVVAGMAPDGPAERWARCASGISACWPDGCHRAAGTSCACSPAASSWRTSPTGWPRWRVNRSRSRTRSARSALRGPGWRQRRLRWRRARRSPLQAGATPAASSSPMCWSRWRRAGRAGWGMSRPARRAGRRGRRRWSWPARSQPASWCRRGRLPICVASWDEHGRRPAICASWPTDSRPAGHGCSTALTTRRVCGGRRVGGGAASTETRPRRCEPAAPALRSLPPRQRPWWPTPGAPQAALEAAGWGRIGLEAFDAVA